MKNKFTITDGKIADGNNAVLPPEEEIIEPIQNSLYATGRFLTEECTELAIGILTYLNESGYKVVRK
jgi:hypothetical protein